MPTITGLIKAGFVKALAKHKSEMLTAWENEESKYRQAVKAGTAPGEYGERRRRTKRNYLYVKELCDSIEEMDE